MTKQERRTALLMRRPSIVRFSLLALLAPLILTLVLLWLNHEYAASERLRAVASISFERRIVLTALLSNLKDAETAQRGYLIANGASTFLDPYEPARAAVNDDLQAVRKLTPSSAELVPLRRIEELVARKFSEMDGTVALQRAGQSARAVALVRTGRGKQTMDRLRAVIGDVVAQEEARSSARHAAYLKQRRATQRLVVAAGICSILLITVLLFVGWRLRRLRYESIVAAFEAAERNQTILDSTVDAMLILNPSGTIETMNAAAVAMFGYGVEELERRDVSTLIDLAPGGGSFHQRVGLIDGHLERSFLPDRIARHHDGREIAVDVALGVMIVPSGDHLIVSLRDISERKRLERMKDDLMSTVSHELRTPLTSIVGALGLLRGGSAGQLPDKAYRLIEIAENNSRRLIRLINDMLDIDRIETGQLQMQREPTDLRTIIDQAAQGSEGLAAAKSVFIAVDAADQPVIVQGDADRLLQVITNLLSNAIRFSPAGGTVTLALEHGDGDQVIVCVDDQGPGVPAAFRNRIFGRFERAAGEQAALGGAGLGLAISKEIVERHDGRIWFADAPGGGARFCFALPILRTAEVDDPAAARVLICEQDQSVAGSLIAIAVKEGCAYKLATNGAEAREATAQTHFDALLIDVNLPEEGGLAFARAVRIGPPPVTAPIIVVATDARGGVAAPNALGVVDWIDKPIELDQLSTALRRALAHSSKERPTVLHLDDDEDLLKVVATALQPETRIMSAIDLASARELLESDPPDAAILDLRLTEGSGLDLIPFLTDAHGVAIPTIIYSAQDVSADLAKQVDAVLVKARGSLPDLKATLRRVLRTRGDGEGLA